MIALCYRAALLQLEEESLPLMLEAMWAANVLDVQSTIRKVCLTLKCFQISNAKTTRELRAKTPLMKQNSCVKCENMGF